MNKFSGTNALEYFIMEEWDREHVPTSTSVDKLCKIILRLKRTDLKKSRNIYRTKSRVKKTESNICFPTLFKINLRNFGFFSSTTIKFYHAFKIELGSQIKYLLSHLFSYSIPNSILLFLFEANDLITIRITYGKKFTNIFDFFSNKFPLALRNQLLYKNDMGDRDQFHFYLNVLLFKGHFYHDTDINITDTRIFNHSKLHAYIKTYIHTYMAYKTIMFLAGFFLVSFLRNQFFLPFFSIILLGRKRFYFLKFLLFSSLISKY